MKDLRVEIVVSNPAEIDNEETLELSKWLDLATSLAETKKFEEMLDLCDKILAEDETNLKAWHLKGNALDNLGRYEEAVKCYDKALSINEILSNLDSEDQEEITDFDGTDTKKDHVDINEIFEKGAALFKEQRFEEGFEYIDEAVTKNPKQELDYKIGALMSLRERKSPDIISLEQKEIPKEAKMNLDYYDKVLSDNPANERAWNNKGNVLMKLGDIDGALECFNKAIQIKEEYVNARIGKGVALRKKGDWGKAIECFDETLRLQPDNVTAIFAKGCTLLDMNRVGEAVDCFDRALKLNPDYTDAWFEKGNALYTQGNIDDAIACFEKALNIDPDDADAWFQRGNALYKVSNFGAAIKSFDNALKLNPDDFGALFQKGNSCYILGFFEKALEAYDRALELKPEDGYALNNKAVTLRKLGRSKEALDYSKKSLQIEPNNEKFWFNMGRILEALHKPKEAEICFERAAEFGIKFS